ncbi:MAG: T9SS type A sorting domain-containing protein [Chlorobi bacterium]|nr:T9SS type A sorting domain-containing protein [Chlorobiota bacterium]
MKKLLLPLFMIFALNLYSQEIYQWSDEQIITDTVNNYSSPFVYPFWSEAWMFYQKNDVNSSIMKMNLTLGNDTVGILKTNGVNYLKPMFKGVFHPNYLGYLFYISDQSGFKNIYASKYYDNDSLGEQVRINTGSPQLNISDYVLSDELISFTTDSSVYVAELKFYMDSVYTERIRLLDTNAFNIVVRYDQACWQKNESSGSHLYMADYKYNADTADKVWTDAYYLDSVGNSNDLSISNAVFGWGENGFIWINDNEIKVLNGNSNYYHIYSVSNFGKPDIREVSMVNWDIAVREPYSLPHYTAFTIGEGSNSGIFCSMGEYGWEDSANISNNNHKDSNPKLFFGESVDGWGTEAYYVYCIWQSEINGHIALSSSKAVAFIGSSIEEKHSIDKYMKVSPNPFRNKLSIKVNSREEKAELIITDMQANILFYYPDIQTNNNWDEIIWTPDGGLKNGTYIIRLKVGSKQYTYKILLLK